MLGPSAAQTGMAVDAGESESATVVIPVPAYLVRPGSDRSCDRSISLVESSLRADTGWDEIGCEQVVETVEVVKANIVSSSDFLPDSLVVTDDLPGC